MKQEPRSMEQVFKGRIEEATTIGQFNEAVYITVNEFIKRGDDQKAFLDAFASTTLSQDSGSIKEQYIQLFNHVCIITWRKLEMVEDNEAVANFSNYMKKRLAESGDRGKGGWWREDTPIEVLYEGLLKAVTELRYVDVANYAMMLEYHNRLYGHQVKRSLHLLDELDEAIALHNKEKFSVSNPPLSTGILSAREKILRRVQDLGHLAYNLANDAINNIIEGGLKRPNTRVSSGDLTWSRDFLRRLLNES